ncbi:DNA cytosine methyltransferase [Streptomyces sp. RKAG337]|uniref:DNA cytosine methyltransferase n=1 Tax=Streptomyces sp. RKAG337 TaxID=2893404 RepID=UPI002034576B|nr:DNA cytosine methyltransferase [Streptomyces sp. RKAG337]MCM2430938.1 DNA cytosine methyltransferase [Streptomyces sp. RKAG337]
MSTPSPAAAPPADTVSDPGGPETMDNEGGAPVSAPCPVAEAERLHARAVERHTAAQSAAEAHSEDVRAAYEAIDWAQRWRLPQPVVDEGWDYRWELEEASTAIWARAHMAHWVAQWARVSVAKVRAALGLPVDDVDLLDDEERDIYIAGLSDEKRAALAGPWPVEWLYRPKPGAPIRIVNLFAGPGGWCEGIAQVLGEPVDMVGVDISQAACATAQAAGFRRICASVTDLDPANPALRYVVAVILSPPCQTLSPGGKLAGLADEAMQLVEDVITEAGAAAGFIMVDDAGDGLEGYAPPTGATWDEVRAPLAALKDERTGLMAEAVIWPLALQAKHGSIRWVAMEQSSNLLKSAVAQYVVEAIRSEFYGAGWEYSDFSLIEAADYGAASKKNRTFMVCMRYTRPFVSYQPSSPIPITTWAACMGWEKGHKVNTRGVRGIDPNTGRPKGGGTFTADQPGTTVTGTAYGWKREADGLTHSHADLGRAVGFRADFPWTHVGRGEGFRNKTQLIADTVSPMAAAAWIGHILGRIWEPRTRAYVHNLYALRGPGRPAVVQVGSKQGDARQAQYGQGQLALKRHDTAGREGRTLTRVAHPARPATTAPPRQRRRAAR